MYSVHRHIEGKICTERLVLLNIKIYNYLFLKCLNAESGSLPLRHQLPPTTAQQLPSTATGQLLPPAATAQLIPPTGSAQLLLQQPQPVPATAVPVPPTSTCGQVILPLGQQT